MTRQFCLLFSLLTMGFCSLARADDPLHVRIDRLIAARPEHAATAAPLATDDEFLRRVSLDLTGRIPSVTQAREFFADADPAKREKRIDALLNSPEYARHFQRVFDVVLMRNNPAKNVPQAEWDTYLRTSFAANKPWDQMAREILSADGTDAATRAASRFYLDREGEVNQITRDVSRVFLGTNLECAQCHDHPQVEAWKQDHYYGLAAFFIRSSLFKEKDNKQVYAEKGEGEVRYESVFEVRDKTSKGPKSSPPKVFDGPPLDEPKFEKADERYVVKPAKDVRPVPKFSRRAKVADLMTSNRQFARSAVNRLWALMLGRGIVHPVELDHPDNPPSHPEMLDLLTDEFIARKFNIRDMLREIALTETYQRSSRRTAPDGTMPEPAEPALFAQALVKPLSAEQFCWTLLEGTGEIHAQHKALGDKVTKEYLATTFAGHESRFKAVFGSPQPGRVQEKFEATSEQILFLSNDALVLGMCRAQGEVLGGRLLQMPADNPQAIAEELFISVLTRRPEPDEVQFVEQWLKDKKDADRAAAVTHLVWAAATSSENRVNH